MSAQHPLDSLIEFATRQTDEAARNLGRLLENEREGQHRLELLQRYRREYEARFVTAARQGLSREEWRNYQTFMYRLEQAVEAQTRDLTQAQGRSESGKAEWVSQRNRLKAYDALSARQQQQLLVDQARREQRQSDEHAAQRFSNPTY
ncbi:MAG TPA: flagellar export protein FliJ [Rhodocyclaceae bacterium]|nr:flagellar export protein FliJ [Rhodocyclaceae bacterium]